MQGLNLHSGPRAGPVFHSDPGVVEGFVSAYSAVAAFMRLPACQVSSGLQRTWCEGTCRGSPGPAAKTPVGGWMAHASRGRPPGRIMVMWAAKVTGSAPGDLMYADPS